MSFRQLWEGTNNDTFFSRLDGRTKLCVLFLFALIMVIVDNPRTLFILFSISIALHIAAGTPVYKWKVLAVFILFGLWGSVASQALFFAQNPRTPILMLISPTFPVLGALTDGLYIYQEGIVYGAIQGNEICIYDRIGAACMLDQRSSPAFKRALILASVAANIFYAGNSYSIFSCIGR